MAGCAIRRSSMEQLNRTILGKDLSKVLAIASILLAAVLLGGCGLPWPFPQPTPDPKLPDAQQILRPLGSGPHDGDVDSLDPGQIQFGFGYGIAQLIFPQLVTLDETQQPVDWA